MSEAVGNIVIVDDWQIVRHNTIRYDTIRDFKVDWKAECGQFNL